MDYTDELTGSFPIDVMKETECELSGLLLGLLWMELQAAEAFLAMGLQVLLLTLASVPIDGQLSVSGCCAACHPF